jgi:hypothetical protein
MLNALHITTFINRRLTDVYACALNPENRSFMAASLSRTEVTKQSDAWVAGAPFGKVRIKFAPANNLGVLHNDVQLESDVVEHDPMRMVPNGEGIEFTFTLFQQPGISQQQLEKDAQAVANDLHTLKTLLESES